MSKTKIFIPGNILYVDEYVFENGESKPKFMIVLHVDEDYSLVLDTLTTSNSKGINPKYYGCNKYGDSSYFYFPKDLVIDEDRKFSFSLPTFLFFPKNVRLESIEKFDKPNVDVSFRATIPSKKFKQLLKCVIQSDMVSRKLLPLILKTKESIE